MKRVLAPSDLPHRARRAGRIRVGGRVSYLELPYLRLSDAFAQLDVVLAAPSLLGPGDLVVIEGRLRGAKLVEARLVERHQHPEVRGDGEHARLTWSGVGPRLAARSRAFAVIREYFAAEGFVEVDTPILVPTPGLDLHVDAVPAESGYLVTSPEFQMKRLLAGGMPRIYQLAHCFRADEAGPLHEPEFALCEWYRAFEDQEAVMRDTETLVERVVREIAGKPRIALDGRRIDVRPPFRRLSVRDAFRRHAGVRDAVDLASSEPDRFFELLVGQVEPALANSRRPLFLCDYPLSQASLARPKPADPSVAERFELYVAGVELCNGFGELTDPLEQRRRFRADNKARKALRRPVYALDERFLAALGEGMPPAGGNALGVDRLVALATGVMRIDVVQAFPRARL